MSRTLARLLLLALAALALLTPGAARAQGAEPPLVVAAGQVLAGNLSTVAQDIVVLGTVQGDVTSWSGNITVDGRVGGDVVSYTGRVKIGPSGQVGGSVLTLGAPVDHAAGAVVSGPLKGGAGDGGALASLFDLFSPRPSRPDSAAEAAGRAIFGLLLAVFVAAFCLLWSALWPNRTAAAGLTLRRLPARSLALGLLTTLLLGLAVPPLLALLAASLIGQPAIVLLLLLVHVPYVYGLATLAHALGGPQAGRPATPSAPRRALAVALAVAAAAGAVAVAMPLAGPALLYLLASPGLGAAVLSRGGVAVARAA